MTSNCDAPIDPNLWPLTTLVEYQNQQAGLYAGTNTRPQWLSTKMLNAIAGIVPRLTDGSPDIDGSMIVLTVGCSYPGAIATLAAEYAEADPLKETWVHFVNAAEGGMDAAEIANPASVYWDHVDTAISNAGHTNAQVGVIWLYEAHEYPTDPFPQHAETLEAELLSIASILETNFPNAKVCYISSRFTGRYHATDNLLSPPPYDLEEGYAAKWAILTQYGDLVLDWGPYFYDQDVPCSYFSPVDGTHLAPPGAEFYGHMLHEFYRDDRLAKRWYR